MKKTSDDVVKECRRLRQVERLSLKAISQRTGVSIGTVSTLLKDIPLTGKEIRERKRTPWNKGKKAYNPQESVWHELSKKHGLDANQIAKKAEAAVLFRLCACGVSVWGSPFDGEKADWLAQVDDRIFKIQVKLALQTGGTPTIAVRSSSSKKPYHDGEVDFLVGYDELTDTAYVFSWDEIKSRKATISINQEHEERWDKLFET